MYDREVIAARVAEFERSMGKELRAYSLQEIDEWKDRLSTAVDHKLNPLRPLTNEEVAFIRNEHTLSKANFGYWAERYATINLHGQDLGPMYPLWESQRLILGKIGEVERRSVFDGHPDGILVNILKARQLGASTLSEAIGAHRVTTQTNVFGLVAADVPDQSAYTFDMLERLVEHLPWYMRPKIKDHVKNTEISFDSGCHVWLGSGKSIRGQEGRRGELARGKTVSFVHLTELSTWDNAGQIDSALIPAIPVHEASIAIFESTAKGRHNWWHEHWLISKDGVGRHHPVFIPWYAEQSKYWLPAPIAWQPSPSTLAHAARVEETGPRWMGAPVKLTREQLYWYETTKSAYERKNKLAMFLEEYCADDEEAFQFSGYGIFSVDVIERIREQAKPVQSVIEISRPFTEIGGGGVGG